MSNDKEGDKTRPPSAASEWPAVAQRGFGDNYEPGASGLQEKQGGYDFGWSEPS